VSGVFVCTLTSLIDNEWHTLNKEYL
jgi:hypothetical protein